MQISVIKNFIARNKKKLEKDVNFQALMFWTDQFSLELEWRKNEVWFKDFCKSLPDFKGDIASLEKQLTSLPTELKAFFTEWENSEKNTDANEEGFEAYSQAWPYILPKLSLASQASFFLSCKSIYRLRQDFSYPTTIDFPNHAQLAAIFDIGENKLLFVGANEESVYLKTYDAFRKSSTFFEINCKNVRYSDSLAKYYYLDNRLFILGGNVLHMVKDSNLHTFRLPTDSHYRLFLGVIEAETGIYVLLARKSANVVDCVPFHDDFINEMDINTKDIVVNGLLSIEKQLFKFNPPLPQCSVWNKDQPQQLSYVEGSFRDTLGSNYHFMFYMRSYAYETFLKNTSRIDVIKQYSIQPTMIVPVYTVLELDYDTNFTFKNFFPIDAEHSLILSGEGVVYLTKGHNENCQFEKLHWKNINSLCLQNNILIAAQANGALIFQPVDELLLKYFMSNENNAMDMRP